MRGWAQTLLVLLLLGLPAGAQAYQRQDWIMSSPAPEGTRLNLDLLVGAVQTTVEHTLPVYGGANALTLRGGGIAALPFGGGQLDVDLRIINLTLGMSVGYAHVWRNQTFGPNVIPYRKLRREREASGDFDSEGSLFWEGRAGLAFLFNEYAVFNHVAYWRILPSMPARSFDNLIAVVHDGRYVRNEFQLFVKHRDWGGIGPMVQLLNFPLDGDWKFQVNYGFMAATRAGLVARDDVIALQVLFHSGDTFGGYDNSGVYGAAMFRGPMNLLLAYRSVIDL